MVEVLREGSARPFPRAAMRAMADAEVVAADSDARPMTEEQFRRAPRVRCAKTLRRALQLTQEEFAAQYQIPIGTLRYWEQGRAEPDQSRSRLSQRHRRRS